MLQSTTVRVLVDKDTSQSCSKLKETLSVILKILFVATKFSRTCSSSHYKRATMYGTDGKQLLLKSTQAYKVWELHVKCYYNTN